MRIVAKFTLLMTFIFLVAGAFAGSDTKPSEIVWGKSDGTCRIGFRGFPTTAAVGDPIQGTLVIENTGTEIVPVMVNLSRPFPQIEIRANLFDGTKVESTSYARDDHEGSDSFLLHNLAPGQSFETPIRLTRLIDMTRTGGYQITFKFANPTTHPSTQPSKHVVSSELLLIHVKDGS